MDLLDSVEIEFRVRARMRWCILRAKPPECGSGLRAISFVISEEEIELFANHECHIGDWRHKLWVFGDRCVFFDMDFPTERQGISQVPFYVAHIPVFVRRLIRRVARSSWAGLPATEGDARVEFDQVRLRRWATKYGCGSGRVLVHLDERAQAALSASVDEEGSNLRDRMQYLERVAQNNTHACHQVSVLKVCKDGSGFFFVLTDSKHRERLHGAIINHGKPGRPDWSIHT